MIKAVAFSRQIDPFDARHPVQKIERARRCEAVVGKTVDQRIEPLGPAHQRHLASTVMDDPGTDRMAGTGAMEVLQKRPVAGGREGDLAADQIGPPRRQHETRPGAAGLARQDDLILAQPLRAKPFEQRFEPDHPPVQFPLALALCEIHRGAHIFMAGPVHTNRAALDPGAVQSAQPIRHRRAPVGVSFILAAMAPDQKDGILRLRG